MPNPDLERGAPVAPHEDGLPVPRRYWAVLSIWMAITLSLLDSSIVNVALPTISRELNASAAESIWIVNAYQLAITVALLPIAALGDIVGYKRIYIAGLAVFTLASLGCALSDSLTTLALARVVQGLGAAGIMSINPALMRLTYPHHLLGRGIGLNAIVVSTATVAGPMVASAILTVATWEWLFAINVPLGLLAVAMASRTLPRTVPSRRQFDWRSALLNALTFGLFILGAETFARGGFARGLAEMAGGLVAGLFLVRMQKGQAAPLLPLDLLRVPMFRLSIATSTASFCAHMLAFVALPFHFQLVLGRSIVETGLLMTPWPIATGIVGPLAGYLADRYPAGLLGSIGLGIMATGLVSLFLLPHDATTLDILWRMAVCGIGFPFFQAPNNRALMSSAPRERSGAAGGMLATARLLGQTTGATIVAILFHAAAGKATSLALLLGGIVSAVGAAISALRIRHAVQPARGAPREAVEDIP